MDCRLRGNDDTVGGMAAFTEDEGEIATSGTHSKLWGTRGDPVTFF